MSGDSSSARRSAVNRGFTLFVLSSVAVHGLAIGGLVYAQQRAPRQVEVIRAIPVELVKLGKPRDPKLLPRITAPAPPPPSAGVALDDGKKSTKPPTKAPPRTPEISDAAKRLLESSAADARMERALSKIEDEEGAEDGDVMGTTTDPARAARGYAATVTRALKTAYSLPETIPPSQRRFLNARVVLYIEATGKVSRYEFIEAHPNKVFMGALETLLQTIALPAPPRELADSLSKAGLEVVFKP